MYGEEKDPDVQEKNRRFNNDLVAQMQYQTAELQDLARKQMARMMDRGAVIDEMGKSADRLQEGATHFSDESVATRKKYWYQNMKMWIIIAVIVVVIIIIIVLVAVLTTRKSGGESTTTKAYLEELNIQMSSEQSGQLVNQPAQSADNSLQTQGTSKRLLQTQAQVSDVVQIMRMNVEKVLERDAKLSQLDDRADALQHGAAQFEMQAGKLKRKYWWKNCKALTALIILVAIIVIVLIAGFASKKKAAITPLQVSSEIESQTPLDESAVIQHNHHRHPALMRNGFRRRRLNRTLIHID